MNITPVSSAARLMLSSVVLRGGNQATVADVTFTYDLHNGLVNFTGVDAYLSVDTIFSVCNNASVHRKYNAHFQAVTLALGLHIYALGTTKVLLDGIAEEPPVSVHFVNRPKVDIFGHDYVVGGRRPVFTPRPRAEVVIEPVTKADVIVLAVMAGVVAVVGLLAAIATPNR